VLTEDYDLAYEDLQLLSSRDALTAFFAKLGYDTNFRLVQHVPAMGITSDNLKSNITHIERLASQDGRLFEVYLFELKRVTVAATQGIVRSFRNRSGDYLLVLADNYQSLDFVLVERYHPDLPKLQEIPTIVPTVPKQVGVRPRILTVSRLKPDQVALRVLRRFSYTEADTFAQYDKLMSAYDVAEWSEPFFNNRALFSDYYLTERLPQAPEWNNSKEASAMTRAFKQLRELYTDVRETFANQPEEVVRAKLLEPALNALGFAIQPVKAGNGDGVQPDYRLYAANSTETIATHPLALCLAYTWNRNLDGKDEQRDNQAPDENPGASVVTVLDKGEVDWAIVTNGKTWRLYAAKAHSRATNYYEIDLEETLALPAAHLEHAFRYFWLLFRANSFIPTERAADGEQRQMCLLDSLLHDSEHYARELGERLKKRVFEDIFPHFARGFIIHARRTQQLSPLDNLTDEERNRLLEPFFSGTLTFLYRLLFLLYAESRDLLPVREKRGYYEKSLEKLKRRVAEKAGTIEDEVPARIKAAYNDHSTELYDRLQELFLAVDQGDSAINVPVYNGGLFVTSPDPADTSPEAVVARFLATHKIPNRELALGLDRMARDLDEKRHDLAPIDYKSLGVRQLGSIYEGLLEFKLRIASEEMAVVRGKKTEEIVPYAEAQQKKLTIVKEGRGKEAHDKTSPKGSVYLENDRRERKATGSYYTPDYIVKYIIENTVGPVLNEKLEALRPAFREAEKTLRAERAKFDALKKQGRIGDSPENQAFLKHRATVNEIFFDLKVLDPAMGSGHFLVEAVDYITDRMADFLTAFKWNPVIHELAKTRQEIQEEMERQSVTVDMNKLTDLNLLKRQVLKRCIYGVDLNPMAVELAKVSLWLDCFTLGAPLSFLDHHMKCGNSLIGGSVQEVEDALSQDLWGNQFAYLLNATQLMRKVGELSDATAQEVAESRKAYKGAYDALAPFKRLLDVWLSEYFGNKGAKHTTRVYAGAIVANNYSKANEQDRQAIEKALALATTKRFFHWELEFPEVFYGEMKRKEKEGFDAVVGNPPYGNVLDTIVKHFVNANYYAVKTVIDLFALFLEQASRITRLNAEFGFIVPSGWLTSPQHEPLRNYLLELMAFQLIVHLPYDVFPDAYIDTIVCIGEKQANYKKSHSCIVTKVRACRLGIHDNAERIFANGLGYQELDTTRWAQEASKRMFTETSTPRISIQQKVKTASVDGSRLLDVDRGITPIIPLPSGSYPNTAQAFDGNFERYSFSEVVMSVKYDKTLAEYTPPEYFQGLGIIIRRIISRKQRIIVALNDKGYVFNKSYLIALCLPHTDYNPYYILSIIASRLQSCLFIWSSEVARRDDFPQLDIQTVRNMPIRRINFTLSPEQRTYYLDKAKNLYEHCLSKDDQTCVTGFVEHHLSKEPEESDVVHDLLAFLAEEMIRLNKEKQAFTKEFLDWLVTRLRILPDKDGRKGIDALTGKSKLADYPGDYQKGEPPLPFEELQDILLKNKGRLGVRLGDDGLSDEIRLRYEASLRQILPLKERLARTDALIDQVVYRLYGLTEEEIRVVEGRE
jgi:hypothetical protein